ncbi:MAG: tol-pal system-associated acyl-CoA thioesterase [Gammaproteobacteria bacterium]|nr:tol-pal system-associated acyl-CoA thioesterase [Gammaproteobacteria bacterium]
MKTAAGTHPEPRSGEAKEFNWPVRVYYEDTDSGGVVYHSNYLKYMERARTEWLRALGYSQNQLQSKEGVVFAVTRMNIQFFKPARIDDLLEVRTRIIRSGGASLTFDQSIFAATGELICRADVEVACLDARTFRPARLPAALRLETNDVD